MKIQRRAALFAVAFSAAAALALPSVAQVNDAKKIQKEADAIAFAEKSPQALALIGGPAKLPDARPFRATGHGEVWLVITKPVADPKNPSAPKRSVVIELNADTGETLDVSTAE
jgi:hypothetical protein